MTKAPLDGTGIEIIQLIVAKNKGILLSITVDGANCHDKKLVKETFDAIIFQRRSQDEGIQNIRMDKGYDFHGIRKLFKESGYTAHIKSPG